MHNAILFYTVIDNVTKKHDISLLMKKKNSLFLKQIDSEKN